MTVLRKESHIYTGSSHAPGVVRMAKDYLRISYPSPNLNALFMHFFVEVILDMHISFRFLIITILFRHISAFNQLRGIAEKANQRF